jgi:bifunctional UDP-N-acetylglucosamine pyrophosphorylase/glucosamine-1-phosphate N-acetyltransferase
MNGDDLYAREDIERLAQMEHAALVKKVEDPRPYGIYEVTEEGRAVRIVEKPKEVFSNLANIGAYKFTPEVFDVLSHTEPSGRGEIEVTSAIQTLAARGTFYVTEAEGYWLPLGYPWHLLDANEYFLSHFLKSEIHGDVSPAAHLNGPVYVGKGTVIRPGVVIDGPVCIGEECSIGPNCWLRAGTTLGNRCRIGQAVEIKNSIFMDDVTAAHLTYIGDSVVGDRVNFGCGTITANVRHDLGNQVSMVNGAWVDTGRMKLGAIIGDDVHTGIHTSIYPGRKMWPGTTTRPGTVVLKDLMN